MGAFFFAWTLLLGGLYAIMCYDATRPENIAQGEELGAGIFMMTSGAILFFIWLAGSIVLWFIRRLMVD